MNLDIVIWNVGTSTSVSVARLNAHLFICLLFLVNIMGVPGVKALMQFKRPRENEIGHV